LDESHPRSLAYQLSQLSAHISALPRTKGKRQLSEEERLILKAYTDLRLSKVLELTQANENEGVYANLEHLLSNTSNLLWRLADVIAEAYFSHSQPSQLIIPTAPEDEL